MCPRCFQHSSQLWIAAAVRHHCLSRSVDGVTGYPRCDRAGQPSYCWHQRSKPTIPTSINAAMVGGAITAVALPNFDEIMIAVQFCSFYSFWLSICHRNGLRHPTIFSISHLGMEARVDIDDNMICYAVGVLRLLNHIVVRVFGMMRASAKESPWN
jgi:hypothetical protein